MSNRLHLTPNQRRELTDIILARGDSYCCFYCQYEFKNIKECWLEHLDDDNAFQLMFNENRQNLILNQKVRINKSLIVTKKLEILANELKIFTDKKNTN